MAPRKRSNPLEIIMTKDYLAPENPGKRLRKQRKDFNGDVITITRTESQHQPRNDNDDVSSIVAPKATKKRAREPESDELPPKRTRRTHNVGVNYLLAVTARTPPTQAALATAVFYAPESAERSTTLWSELLYLPDVTQPAAFTQGPANSFDTNGNWIEPVPTVNARGRDPDLVPPTNRYMAHLKVGRDLDYAHCCKFDQDPRVAIAKVMPTKKKLVTAGIPLADDTPEDLVPHVEKKRIRKAAR